MSDYSISIKVRNGRIRRKMAECGFSSVNELCRKSGLSPQEIGALLNLKLPPLTATGRWRQSAAALAEVLGCTCEELFSETQRTLAVRDNRGECFITEAGLLKLSSRVERPLQQDPGEQLLDDADEQTKIAVIRRALDGLNVTARDRQIVEKHFGIGCEEKTLADLALELNVSEGFVRRCLSRALERLRGDKEATRRSLLQAYRPADAMGTAHETRARNAQKRAAVLPSDKKPSPQDGVQRMTYCQPLMGSLADPERQQPGALSRPRFSTAPNLSVGQSQRRPAHRADSTASYNKDSANIL